MNSLQEHITIYSRQESSNTKNKQANMVLLKDLLNQEDDGYVSNSYPIVSGPSIVSSPSGSVTTTTVSSPGDNSSSVSSPSDSINNTAASSPSDSTVSSNDYQSNTVTSSPCSSSSDNEENNNNNTLFYCKWDGCNQEFIQPEILYHHLTTDHVGRKSLNNLQLNCHWLDCNIKTEKRDHITSHLRVHVPLKPFSCQTCTKKFKRPQDLKKHLKIHLNNKNKITKPNSIINDSMLSNYKPIYSKQLGAKLQTILPPITDTTNINTTTKAISFLSALSKNMTSQFQPNTNQQSSVPRLNKYPHLPPLRNTFATSTLPPLYNNNNARLPHFNVNNEFSSIQKSSVLDITDNLQSLSVEDDAEEFNDVLEMVNIMKEYLLLSLLDDEDEEEDYEEHEFVKLPKYPKIVTV